MMYPFMTLNDNTEITYSSPINSNKGQLVKVYIETPIKNGFKSANCMLPQYDWENHGYTDKEMDYLRELIKSVAHIIVRLSKEGGSQLPPPEGGGTLGQNS